MKKQLVSEPLQWIVVIVVIAVALMYDIDKGMKVGMPFNFYVSNFRFTFNWMPNTVLIVFFFTFFRFLQKRR